MNTTFTNKMVMGSKAWPNHHSCFGTEGKTTVAFERTSSCDTAEYVPTLWSNSLASAGLAKDIVRCFTFSDGSRALDCSKAFRQVRKAFGTNFDFAFGFPASEPFKLGIAKELGEKIRAFVLSGHDPDIEVIDGAFGKKTLLVDTCQKSSRFDIPVFARLDVHPLDGGPCLSLEHILFTDWDGNSIAGIADISDRICDTDVRHAAAAFRDILGENFDVLGVNSRLYQAWDEAHAKSSSEFSSDLSEFQREGEFGTTICQFTQQDGVWKILIVVDGEEWTLGKIVGNRPELVADPCATERALEAIRCALMRLSPNSATTSVNYRHVFDNNHLARFSDSFAELARKDPSAAKAKFREALRLELENASPKCDDWIPCLYHAGMEKSLMAGSRIDSEVALLIPLFLTEEDCERGIPSIYLVACLKKTSNGSAVCAFPTVLSGRQAERNHRYFRRAVRNGLHAA